MPMNHGLSLAWPMEKVSYDLGYMWFGSALEFDKF